MTRRSRIRFHDEPTGPPTAGDGIVGFTARAEIAILPAGEAGEDARAEEETLVPTVLDDVCQTCLGRVDRRTQPEEERAVRRIQRRHARARPWASAVHALDLRRDHRPSLVEIGRFGYIRGR